MHTRWGGRQVAHHRGAHTGAARDAAGSEEPLEDLRFVTRRNAAPIQLTIVLIAGSPTLDLNL
ncbi:hypothetical protein C9E81_00375 [Paracoccus alkanivorans]|uniref:Uncharacterized protein n=1 Tax=Paracoccus alkanivorans TaxID=2116655 RepID=A0A3M0MNH2_9RHOB|nr:hypothetical protein C9E81_00375 [Paracoccus alkanivorans]